MNQTDELDYTALNSNGHPYAAETIPDELLCPITRQIYAHPIKLISSVRNNNITAVVEEEAWIRYLTSAPSPICPTTRDPIAFYVRDKSMEYAVETYLQQHPEHKCEQYSLEHDVISSGHTAIVINIQPTPAREEAAPDQPPPPPAIIEPFFLEACFRYCWHMEYCVQRNLSILLGMGVYFGWFAALGSGVNALGAAILGYHKDEFYQMVKAGSVGYVVFFSICMFFIIAYDGIYCPTRDLRYVFSSSLLFTTIGVASSIIGELMLHGLKEDEISQAAASSAVGMGITSVAWNWWNSYNV